jgi:hypothetical protein
MFSLVLILKKENKIFNEVVKYVDGWFDNIIEIKRARTDFYFKIKIGTLLMLIIHK